MLNRKTVKCNRCNKELNEVSQGKALETIAKEHGWVRTRESVWYCNECCKHVSE